MLKFNEQNLLFTGDIEEKVKKELLKENPELKVDLIKVPHHGSKTSSFAGWIKSLNPKTAVIQVGNNHYGHPAAKVIRLYQKQGASVFRNDLNGNVVVTADGKNHTVRVDRNPENTETVTEKDKVTEAEAEEKSSSKADSKKDNLININTASASILDQLWGNWTGSCRKYYQLP